MADRDQWEPDLFSDWASLPTYVDVIAECHCGRWALVPRDLPISKTTLIVYVRNRLTCQACGRRGAKRLLVRKMAR